MAVFPYLIAGYLFVLGVYGVVRSRHLVQTVVCVAVSQSATYVLLLSAGFQKVATAPIFGQSTPVGTSVVDPVVQALTLTDIVVSATVTALLLALAIQIHRRHDTVDPDELRSLRG
ncbi:sodium:proton antiporter [Fodinicola acaciae]|uniref:sodium:proton antiporter n=1 Tax=Fodinicola acaciae TaxID=2681555 RepID=UPI0013D3349E|nr:sodium:proton antiporter [Fodinicola acaciae]